MTLLNEEQKNPKVLLVREFLEEQVFGLPNDQSRTLHKQVQDAMSDLKVILAPTVNPKELSWARSWFEAMDVDAINPVDLTLFADNWMKQYLAVTKSLRDFKVIA